MLKSNHLKRIKSSVILLAVGIPLFLISKWTYALVILFFSLLAYKEFLQIAENLELPLNKNAFRLAALGCFLSSLISKDFLNLAFFLTVLFALFFHTVRFFNFLDCQEEKEIKKTLFQSFLFIFGLFYLAWLPGYEIVLRAEGLFFLILIRSSVIINDICSYYFGRYFGRRKLADLISPNKTLEGSLGGICCGILIPIVLYLIFSKFAFFDLELPKIKIVLLISFLLLINLIAQTGDLFESLIKRVASKKDSGNFLSGQGGIMDRADSHILTALPTYYFFFII